VVCFYSLTKRFTDFTHIYLGVALAIAPLGAWLAVRGGLSFDPVFGRNHRVVAAAAGCCGDLLADRFRHHLRPAGYEFDRKAGLHSLVVAWGPANALTAAFMSHMVMWGLLVGFGLLARFRVAYLAGLIIILMCLVFEHWLARRRSLNWINNAFFRLNALISLIFLVVTVAEVVFPKFYFGTMNLSVQHSDPCEQMASGGRVLMPTLCGCLNRKLWQAKVRDMSKIESPKARFCCPACNRTIFNRRNQGASFVAQFFQKRCC